MSENLPIPSIVTSNGTQSGNVFLGSSDGELTLEGSSIKLVGGLTVQYDNISSGVSPFILEDKHHLVDISNSSTNIVELPPASIKKGKLYIISKNYVGGTLTILTQSLDTIDGDNTISMSILHERISLISTGSNGWLII
jgi:hypothetical protein